MLKQYSNIFRGFLVLVDCVLLVAAFFLAAFICMNLNERFPYNYYYFLKYYFGVLATVIVVWIGCFYVMGMYESFRLKRSREVLWVIVQTSFITFMLVSTIFFAFKMEYISRAFIGLFFSINAILFLVQKLGIVFFLRLLRLRGFNFRNILVVGSGERARKLIRYLNRRRELGLNVVGLIEERSEHVGELVEGHTVLGGLEKVPEVLFNNVIDYAVFVVSPQDLPLIEPALLQCELVGVSTSVDVDFFRLHLARGKETNFFGVPMVTYEVTPHSVTALVAKRFIDIVISSIALFGLAPIFGVLAVLIKMTAPGPVFFVQERCGLNGRTFKLYKFRTMVIDAEKKQKELMSHNEMSGPVFKMTHDPRITSIGKILRKFSLDELPQLWNVLIGDMSLVGPRPPLPSEVSQYDAWHKRRLSMRPGLTCIWQAGGRNRVSNFDQWVKMDLEYVDNWSTSLDMKILAQTIPAVISGSGAK